MPWIFNIQYVVKLKKPLILLTFCAFLSMNYLNKPMSLRSLKVVKNINDNNKNKPIGKNSLGFCDRGRLKLSQKHKTLNVHHLASVLETN